MSHPNNFVEGTFQSEIPRCPHSVFRLSKDPPLKSSVCSLCRTAITRPITKPKKVEEADVRAVAADEAEHEQISEEATLLLEWSKNKNRGEVKNEESETNAEGERATSTLSGEGGDEASPSDESGTVETIFDEESESRGEE